MSTLKTHNLQSPDAGSVNIVMAPNAGMVVAGLSTYSNQINVGSNIKLGTAGVVTATSFVGSGAQLTGITSPAITSIANDAVSRVLTTDGDGTATAHSEVKIETVSGNKRLSINRGTGSTEVPLLVRRTDASGIVAEFSNSGGYGVYIGQNGATGEGYIRTATGQPLVFTTNAGSGITNERLRIDSSGNMSLGYAGSPATSNGNVTKKFGIRSTQNNVLIGETSATSEHTGFIFEARQTGRSGTPRIAQINMGNDAGADGRIKFQTAPDGADVQNRLWISNNGIRSYATFVDTSYHANPDPLGDGSGIVYYRLNDNFHDSGRFAQHGTSIQGGDPTFALVNSTGEKCWNNPTDGAINIPNLKNSYPFSMAAWINVSSWPTTADNDLIMNLNIGGQRISLSICCFNTAVSDGADFFIMYGGTGHHYFRPSSKPTNTWIHVVYSVVSSNNTAHRVYQNGADLTTRGNRGGNHGGSAGYAIGGNAVNSERFAIGRIGSIRFFNKALSSSEASALYTNDTFYT